MLPREDESARRMLNSLVLVMIIAGPGAVACFLCAAQVTTGGAVLVAAGGRPVRTLIQPVVMLGKWKSLLCSRFTARTIQPDPASYCSNDYCCLKYGNQTAIELNTQKPLLDVARGFLTPNLPVLLRVFGLAIHVLALHTSN